MDPSNKDDVLQNTSCWICELGELEGTTRKKDVDRLKAFLTNKSDRVRAPYAVAACDYPRLTCYAGTVNEPDFLREAGRRFVVLPIVGVDLSRLKKIDMNRLWAEVYAAYLENPNNFRLTREELQGVIADSEQFRTVFSEEQLIRDLLDWDSDPDTWQERTAGEIALMLERQDMLSKLTENQCLDEYGYSETHCIDYIGRLELPNVTKVAEHMGMTRGAISKMTKKLLAKGLIEKYTLETNKKEVYFKLTDQGRLLFDEHAKRHKRWEKRDMEFLARYSVEDVRTVSRFMTEFNGYLEEQIETITGTQAEG